MKLYIDTSNSEKIIVGLDEKKVERESKVEKSQMLLSIIEDELNKKGKTLKDILEIEVVLGSGSFTGLRVGTSVANSLAWALKIPINGKRQLVEPVY